MKVLFVEAEETFYMPVNTKIPKRWAYLGEIATYIAKENDVKVMDCINPQISHAEILNEIANNKYELICFLTRIETVNSLLKLVPLIKKISSDTKLLIYGDAPCMFPNFLKENLSDVDAIIESGDWEVAISNYIKYINNEKQFKNNNIPGITLKINKTWQNAKTCNGENFVGWSFTDLDSKLLDVDLYKSLRHDEVTISASRGCPYNCKFCLAVKTFDKDDRRKDIKELVNYMLKNKNKVKTYKLFSPTFTYNLDWVVKFCDELIKREAGVKWVTTSRTDKLQDENMIKKMSLAGCKKIAVGVETLDKESNRELRKFNDIENYKENIRNMFLIAKKYNIEIKPLLMMGIKGQTKENIKESLLFLKEIGAKEVRVAAYSPRQLLTKKDNEGTLTIEDINAMDKMTYIDYLPEKMTEEDFLKIIYETEKFNEILQ